MPLPASLNFAPEGIPPPVTSGRGFPLAHVFSLLCDEAAKLREIVGPLSAHLCGAGDFAALRHGLHFAIFESEMPAACATEPRSAGCSALRGLRWRRGLAGDGFRCGLEAIRPESAHQLGLAFATDFSKKVGIGIAPHPEARQVLAVELELRPTRLWLRRWRSRWLQGIRELIEPAVITATQCALDLGNKVRRELRHRHGGIFAGLVGFGGTEFGRSPGNRRQGAGRRRRVTRRGIDGYVRCRSRP